MPILLKDEVPDPVTLHQTVKDSILTACLKRLYKLACTFHSHDTRPRVWFEQADLRLQQNFTVTRLYSDTSEVNDWWREL